MAAPIKMIKVVSCMASNINCKNVFGGLGGIILEPNAWRLRCCSCALDEIPERIEDRNGYILND